MKYCDLQPAIEAYERGENVTAVLRRMFGLQENSPEIIEIAYDLQAGTYVKGVSENLENWNAYCDELASVIAPIARSGPGAPRILDVGSGEMTTLSGVARLAFPDDAETYACDISFSRIKVGRSFAETMLDSGMLSRLRPFVGDMFKLPLLANSMDLVLTSHALEPNGGKELTILRELFRVSANNVVLFEPSYEMNSVQGRQRMEALGYVKALPQAIQQAGGELVTTFPIRSAANPLNPTWAYVCRKTDKATRRVSADVWACPATQLPMMDRGDCFFCGHSRLAYPLVQSIPILRVEQAILASRFE